MADYQSMLAANPYKNQQRKHGLWDTILESFGMRSGADAWNENMSVQASEYDAMIEQMKFQNEFNDPSAQASRMRQAGLNPDLQGLGDVADAANPPQDPSTPMQAESDAGLVTHVTQMAVNAFNTALGVVQGLQGMFSTHLANSMREIEIEKGVSDYAKQMWPYMLPESPDPVAGDGMDLFKNTFDWKAAALNNATKFAGNINRKYRKKFLNEIQQYWSSGPGRAESYDTWKKSVQNRRGYYSERGTFYSDIDDVLQDIVDPLVQASMQITRQNQSTELAEGQAAQNMAEYNKKLYGENGLDPNAEAAASNAQNALVDTNSSTVNALNSTVGDIISNLQHTAKTENGLKGALANVALVLMASVRLWLANVGMPSISSSRSSGTGYGNGLYQNQSRSSSFSF